VAPAARLREEFPAAIWSVGPGGEPDPGGNLYWVRELGCNATSGGTADGCPTWFRPGGRWVVAEDWGHSHRVYATDGTVRLAAVRRMTSRQATPTARFFFRCSAAALESDFAVSVLDGSDPLGEGGVPGIFYGSELAYVGEWRTFLHWPQPVTRGALAGLIVDLAGGDTTAGGPVALRLRSQLDAAANVDVAFYLHAHLVTEEFTAGMTWGTQPAVDEAITMGRGDGTTYARSHSAAEWYHLDLYGTLAYTRPDFLIATPPATPVYYGVRLSCSMVRGSPAADAFEYARVYSDGSLTPRCRYWTV